MVVGGGVRGVASYLVLGEGGREQLTPCGAEPLNQG